MKAARDLVARARQTLVARSGPLTRQLLLEPGRFGLGKVPARLKPEATTGVVCGFCSTGCGLDVHLKDGVAVNLTPRTDHPVNLGMACPKGWEALTPLAAPDRATTPLMRADRGGRAVPVSWPEALDTMVSRFKAIQDKHGPASLAFLSTGQIVNEEMALLGALAKFGMGMVHGDGNTRQCMATAVTAYKQSFGFDAPPFTYADFEQSDVIVLVGSNLCIAHPIMWERVCRNPHRPAVVVIDPRKTETAMAATHHLALRPKSDLALMYGVAHQLIRRGMIDQRFIDAHTTGFAAMEAHVAAWDRERVCNETGLDGEAIEELVRLIGEGKRVSFWWTMGVNQSHEATRVAQAIINLALITGNIGRPGTGANSVTGQCNAMGSRLFSNTTNLIGGHDFTNPEHRRKIADILGLDVGRIPVVNSLAYDQILEKVLAGEIRGLWIVATNPAHSWINQRYAHDVLSRLEYLVVQDMYTSTETAVRADLLLPAAGWGEKEGTFINSERRLGLSKKVARAPGQALADFHIFQLVAEAWGVGDLFRRWSSPEAVFEILKEVSRGQPCDISGVVDYSMIDRLGGVQWPLPEGTTLESNERRLFSDGRFFFADGRARLIVDQPRPVPEMPSKAFPLVLLTGRGSSSQWHTQTRTGKSAVLRKLAPADLYVEVNPADAAPLKLTSHEWVEVISPRGAVRARAFITPTVRAGEVFMPMHYPDMNRLTFPSFDPHSRQPSYKYCAVRIERVDPARKA
jgi:anaerobic selenocysteine-containing dehydrogenase